MENLFATLGNILRPESTKKTFAIIETTAEQSRGYNRATKGRETIAQREASSAEEALEEWLADKALAYGISRVQERFRGGFVKDSDADRYVWIEGDTSADFGDYTVSAEAI
jgi:hypothetical protein